MFRHQIMPSMRVMALAEFFFPWSRYKKVKRSSRRRMPAVNISQNHGSNVFPCVVMSASSGSSPATSHCCAHRHAHECVADVYGRMTIEDHAETPRFGSMSLNRSSSPTYFEEDEQNTFTPVTPSQRRARDTAPGYRNNSRRPAERISNNHRAARIDCHNHGRFTAYVNAMQQTQTCFVGANPLASDDPYFFDQTIRFRVIDRTGDQDADRAPGGEREVMVVSSPANIHFVLDTLAPRGSGRRIVIRARGAHGISQYGNEEFLALTVLPQGLPFDVVLEED